MRGGPVAKTIDAYLKTVGPDKRAALQRLREQIHAALPKVEECISYGMPGFRYGGKVVLWMGAAAKHCSFFPGAIVQEHRADLKKYDISKGTIRFQPDEPLPAALVKKLAKAAVAARGAK
jgi:uncharacterized protein YdhG (YjbR/CyaY superfamily)